MALSAKKIIGIIVILVPLALWIAKVANVVEVEQQNDRIDINNQVVDVLNELQEKLDAPQEFFNRFTALDTMDESQQRGSWALLELMMDYDFSEDIQQAQQQINTIFDELAGDDHALRDPALALINSMQNYDTTYQEVAKTIASKSLTTEELEVYLSEQFYLLAIQSDDAADNFIAAQDSYIDGEQ